MDSDPQTGHMGLMSVTVNISGVRHNQPWSVSAGS